ncbi:MAG: aldo/keto reductase [Candidatus Eremiobacteraeota bacterium]|nr:aldo/keto reductase [Candidatus Eremiobacteraeota bacterium]
MSTSETSLRSDARPAAASGTVVLGGDLPVHRLGFGAMRITGNGIWGEPADHDEAIAVLKAAVELGVTIIDTADSYGPEVSERLIAEALYPYPSGLVIATKAGLVRPGPSQWVPDGRPQHLREAVEGSLRRLRLERIDLLQLHRIDPKVPFEDQIGALVELQRAGKIRHIGLSNVSVKEIEAARRMATIVSVQNLYNLTDRESEDVVEYCTREKLGFIPWFPLDTGDLLKSGGTLAQIAQRLQATPAEVALAWLLAKSPVMLPIPGTSNRKHLRENLGAALLRLSAEEMRELEACAQG